MNRCVAHMVMLLALASLSHGCGVSGPRPLSEPRYGLRKDIFQDVPLWESRLFDAPARAAITEEPARQDVLAQAKISKYTVPGLYVLLAQVDPGNPMLASSSDDARILERTRARGEVNLQVHREAADRFVGVNNLPLPPDLASEPLTKAYVLSLAAGYHNAQVRQFARDRTVAVSPTMTLPETQFTIQHFRSLGEGFLRANLAMIGAPRDAPVPGGPPAAAVEVERRLQRIRQMSALVGSTGAAGPAAAGADSPQITWDGMAFQYFAAYYRGDFVDRTSGKLSKPDLGKKISNETITSALAVGLESIHDFAVLTASRGQAERAIKAPVTFTGDPGREQWPSGHKPTLVTVTQKLLKKKQGDPITPWKYVVEPAADNGKEGISPAKRKVIRWISGLAGDGAGSLSDLATRTFGGIHIGFGLLGKVSVGDHDTLAKVVSTTIETFAHRGSELYASHMLYDVKFDGPPIPDPSKDSLGVLLLKYVVIFDGDAGD